MRVNWKCNICDNIFYFNNTNQCLEFMRDHATTCCRILYPNGLIAYVGPTNVEVNRAINNVVTMPVVCHSGGITSTEHVERYVDDSSRSWITIPERVGHATAKILMVLRGMYDIDLEQELRSLALVDKEPVITELDREKAVKIYCTSNQLVDKVQRIVYIDELLYSILVDDDQIMRTMDHIICETGKRRYYIHTNSRNMYARQVACALRRLDKATYDANNIF